MNSGSEQKLSMDELLEKNRPAQMVQTTPQPPAQELTLPPEVRPTKAEWEDLQSELCTLGYPAALPRLWSVLWHSHSYLRRA